ncbi:MAG TPA: PEP/pyruvate-binding domain-containing protein [Thermomicrobiales bacterium]|nr:PEP/pyruvate-binding domain-containing protein [Thermomicrobiales bacterium]
MSILWLGEPGCHDPAVVGGKAANLSRLAAAHRVPPGFCLTATGAAEDGDGAPAALCATLAVAYRDLGARCRTAAPAVAVRSSAVDEDGLDASFAGQHATYLNVIGCDALAAAVARCRASLWSTRALAYRREQGLARGDARLAVLVQQLVAADVSAVAFSTDPLTGKRDAVVINASWGLGESIVGGTVTPDTYVVDKASLAVVSRRLGAKERMTVLAADGTREVAVPRALRGQPALDDTRAGALARLTVALELALGRPVDVECAFQGDRLYLLQCRPITTLG